MAAINPYIARAWRSSRLWYQRKSLRACLADPVMRYVLERHAAAIQRMDERRGKRLPIQSELPL